MTLLFLDEVVVIPLLHDSLVLGADRMLREEKGRGAACCRGCAVSWRCCCMLDSCAWNFGFPVVTPLEPCALCSQVVELKFGGKDIPVTGANRIAYIHLVADYRLNKQIRPHCLAFRQGLANVVSLEWLRMFDQQEIQVPGLLLSKTIVSGSQTLSENSPFEFTI